MPKIRLSEEALAYATGECRLPIPQRAFVPFLREQLPQIWVYYHQMYRTFFGYDPRAEQLPVPHMKQLMKVSDTLTLIVSAAWFSNDHRIFMPSGIEMFVSPYYVRESRGDEETYSILHERSLPEIKAAFAECPLKSELVAGFNDYLNDLNSREAIFVLVWAWFFVGAIARTTSLIRSCGLSSWEHFDTFKLGEPRRPRMLPPNRREEGNGGQGQREPANAAIQPIVMREKMTFADVGGQQGAVSEMEDICRLLKNPQTMKRWGAKIPRGICFHGGPGNGKTLLGMVIACMFGLDFYSIKSSDVFEKWVGQSERNMDEIFKTVKAKGGILFIDEADALGRSRDANHGSSVNGSVLSVINSHLDGMDVNSNMIVIFATNRPEDIDPALRRPGRIDLFIEIKDPDENGRIEILNIHMNKAIGVAKEAGNEQVFAADLDVRSIARKTDGFSGAELANIIQRAVYRKACKEILDGALQPPVSDAEIMAIVKTIKLEKKAKAKDTTIVPFGG